MKRRYRFRRRFGRGIWGRLGRRRRRRGIETGRKRAGGLGGPGGRRGVCGRGAS